MKTSGPVTIHSNSATAVPRETADQSRHRACAAEALSLSVSKRSTEAALLLGPALPTAPADEMRDSRSAIRDLERQLFTLTASGARDCWHREKSGDWSRYDEAIGLVDAIRTKRWSLDERCRQEEIPGYPWLPAEIPPALQRLREEYGANVRSAL